MTPEKEMQIKKSGGWIGQTWYPEPTSRIPPGMFAFEEGGVITWVGNLEKVHTAPPFAQGIRDWARCHTNRYLKGVPS